MDKEIDDIKRIKRKRIIGIGLFIIGWIIVGSILIWGIWVNNTWGLNMAYLNNLLNVPIYIVGFLLVAYGISLIRRNRSKASKI